MVYVSSSSSSFLPLIHHTRRPNSNNNISNNSNNNNHNPDLSPCSVSSSWNNRSPTTTPTTPPTTTTTPIQQQAPPLLPAVLRSRDAVAFSGSASRSGTVSVTAEASLRRRNRLVVTAVTNTTNTTTTGMNHNKGREAVEPLHHPRTLNSKNNHKPDPPVFVLVPDTSPRSSKTKRASSWKQPPQSQQQQQQQPPRLSSPDLPTTTLDRSAVSPVSPSWSHHSASSPDQRSSLYLPMVMQGVPHHQNHIRSSSTASSVMSSKQELQIEDLLRRFTSSNSSHASSTNGSQSHHGSGSGSGDSRRLYPARRSSAHAALSWSPKSQETLTAAPADANHHHHKSTSTTRPTRVPLSSPPPQDVDQDNPEATAFNSATTANNKGGWKRPKSRSHNSRTKQPPPERPQQQPPRRRARSRPNQEATEPMPPTPLRDVEGEQEEGVEVEVGGEPGTYTITHTITTLSQPPPQEPPKHNPSHPPTQRTKSASSFRKKVARSKSNRSTRTALHNRRRNIQDADQEPLPPPPQPSEDHEVMVEEPTTTVDQKYNKSTTGFRRGNHKRRSKSSRRRNNKNNNNSHHNKNHRSKSNHKSRKNKHPPNSQNNTTQPPQQQQPPTNTTTVLPKQRSPITVPILAPQTTFVDHPKSSIYKITKKRGGHHQGEGESTGTVGIAASPFATQNNRTATTASTTTSGSQSQPRGNAILGSNANLNHNNPYWQRRYRLGHLNNPHDYSTYPKPSSHSLTLPVLSSSSSLSSQPWLLPQPQQQPPPSSAAVVVVAETTTNHYQDARLGASVPPSHWVQPDSLVEPRRQHDLGFFVTPNNNNYNNHSHNQYYQNHIESATNTSGNLSTNHDNAVDAVVASSPPSTTKETASLALASSTATPITTTTTTTTPKYPIRATRIGHRTSTNSTATTSAHGTTTQTNTNTNTNTATTTSPTTPRTLVDGPFLLSTVATRARPIVGVGGGSNTHHHTTGPNKTLSNPTHHNNNDNHHRMTNNSNVPRSVDALAETYLRAIQRSYRHRPTSNNKNNHSESNHHKPAPGGNLRGPVADSSSLPAPVAAAPWTQKGSSASSLPISSNNNNDSTPVTPWTIEHTNGGGDTGLTEASWTQASQNNHTPVAPWTQKALSVTTDSTPKVNHSLSDHPPATPDTVATTLPGSRESCNSAGSSSELSTPSPTSGPHELLYAYTQHSSAAAPSGGGGISLAPRNSSMRYDAGVSSPVLSNQAPSPQYQPRKLLQSLSTCHEEEGEEESKKSEQTTKEEKYEQGLSRGNHLQQASSSSAAPLQSEKPPSAKEEKPIHTNRREVMGSRSLLLASTAVASSFATTAQHRPENSKSTTTTRSPSTPLLSAESKSPARPLQSCVEDTSSPVFVSLSTVSSRSSSSSRTRPRGGSGVAESFLGQVESTTSSPETLFREPPPERVTAPPAPEKASKKSRPEDESPFSMTVQQLTELYNSAAASWMKEGGHLKSMIPHTTFDNTGNDKGTDQQEDHAKGDAASSFSNSISNLTASCFQDPDMLLLLREIEPSDSKAKTSTKSGGNNNSEDRTKSRGRRLSPTTKRSTKVRSNSNMATTTKMSSSNNGEQPGKVVPNENGEGVEATYAAALATCSGSKDTENTTFFMARNQATELLNQSGVRGCLDSKTGSNSPPNTGESASAHVSSSCLGAQQIAQRIVAEQLGSPNRCRECPTSRSPEPFCEAFPEAGGTVRKEGGTAHKTASSSINRDQLQPLLDLLESPSPAMFLDDDDEEKKECSEHDPETDEQEHSSQKSFGRLQNDIKTSSSAVVSEDGSIASRQSLQEDTVTLLPRVSVSAASDTHGAGRESSDRNNPLPMDIEALTGPDSVEDSEIAAFNKNEPDPSPAPSTSDSSSSHGNAQTIHGQVSYPSLSFDGDAVNATVATGPSVDLNIRGEEHQAGSVSNDSASTVSNSNAGSSPTFAGEGYMGIARENIDSNVQNDAVFEEMPRREPFLATGDDKDSDTESDREKFLNEDKKMTAMVPYNNEVGKRSCHPEAYYDCTDRIPSCDIHVFVEIETPPLLCMDSIDGVPSSCTPVKEVNPDNTKGRGSVNETSDCGDSRQSSPVKFLGDVEDDILVDDDARESWLEQDEDGNLKMILHNVVGSQDEDENDDDCDHALSQEDNHDKEHRLRQQPSSQEKSHLKSDRSGSTISVPTSADAAVSARDEDNFSIRSKIDGTLEDADQKPTSPLHQDIQESYVEVWYNGKDDDDDDTSKECGGFLNKLFDDQSTHSSMLEQSSTFKDVVSLLSHSSSSCSSDADEEQDDLSSVDSNDIGQWLKRLGERSIKTEHSPVSEEIATTGPLADNDRHAVTVRHYEPELSVSFHNRKVTRAMAALFNVADHDLIHFESSKSTTLQIDTRIPCDIRGRGHFNYLHRICLFDNGRSEAGFLILRGPEERVNGNHVNHQAVDSRVYCWGGLPDRLTCRLSEASMRHTDLIYLSTGPYEQYFAEFASGEVWWGSPCSKTEQSNQLGNTFHQVCTAWNDIEMVSFGPMSDNEDDGPASYRSSWIVVNRQGQAAWQNLPFLLERQLLKRGLTNGVIEILKTNNTSIISNVNSDSDTPQEDAEAGAIGGQHPGATSTSTTSFLSSRNRGVSFVSLGSEESYFVRFGDGTIDYCLFSAAAHVCEELERSRRNNKSPDNAATTSLWNVCIHPELSHHDFVIQTTR